LDQVFPQLHATSSHPVPELLCADSVPEGVRFDMPLTCGAGGWMVPRAQPFGRSGIYRHERGSTRAGRRLRPGTGEVPCTNTGKRVVESMSTNAEAASEEMARPDQAELEARFEREVMPLL